MTHVFAFCDQGKETGPFHDGDPGRPDPGGDPDPDGICACGAHCKFGPGNDTWGALTGPVTVGASDQTSGEAVDLDEKKTYRAVSWKGR